MKHLFASIFVLAACSHDPLEAGAGNDVGNGTNTLFVNGDAFAEPRNANASHATDFDTSFSVRISLNNQPVQTGSGTMRSAYASTPLTWTDADGGHWIGRAANYDEVYELDVTSGLDKVTGVIVDGPDIHVFTTPLL